MPKKKNKTYLGQLAAAADKLFQGQAIDQYAAICYRRRPDSQAIEVLLITSRETGRWVIPKGWAMDKRLPHQVAEREAWEEAGVKGKAKKKPFGYYTYLKTLDTGGKVPSIVQVHLVEIVSLQTEFKEKGQRSIAWFPPHEAATHVREPELKGLLGKVESLLGRQATRGTVDRKAS
ncbi:NUDIX hydrolase [Rhizobium sp. LjRoot258]|uniref:NUDIX hydrolase n=1 Tax=Rhizobium sp. LjRoot258 TaxID=3342299 RepID=UPI003ED03B61